MPQRRQRWAVVLVAVSLLGAAPAATSLEEGEVEGSGESAVIGDNVASARRRALASAGADAVARAVGKLIGSEVAAREASRLRSIDQRAARYLRTYRVLEERQEGTRFLLRLAAKLDERRLRQDLLGLGLTAAPPATPSAPTLQLLSRGDAPLGPELVAALRAALARGGVSSEVTRSESCSPSRSCLEARLGLEAAEGVRGLCLQAVRAELALSLRQAGAVTVSKRAEAWGFAEPSPAVAPHPDSQRGSPAARLAFERVLPIALSQILDELRRRHPPPVSTIRISGLTELSQLHAIERSLRERVPGVSSNGPREVARGEAWIEVKSALDARALGASLEKLAGTGFSLTISGIEGGTLWLTLRPSATTGGTGTAR